MLEAVQSFDESVSLFFQSIHNPVTDLFMKVITDSVFLWLAVSILLICFKKTRRAGIMIGISLIVSLIVNNVVLKSIFVRERPFVVIEAIELIIDPPSGYSFPSSHAGTAASAAAANFFSFRKTNKIAAFGGILWALLIAFSRLYLCVHFLTDVIAGFLSGTVLGIATCLVISAVCKRNEGRKLQ